MEIVQVGSRYHVTTDAGRLHILNINSLEWNLKHVFGLSAKLTKQVVARVEVEGTVKLERKVAA